VRCLDPDSGSEVAETRCLAAKPAVSYACGATPACGVGRYLRFTPGSSDRFRYWKEVEVFSRGVTPEQPFSSDGPLSSNALNLSAGSWSLNGRYWTAADATATSMVSPVMASGRSSWGSPDRLLDRSLSAEMMLTTERGACEVTMDLGSDVKMGVVRVFGAYSTLSFELFRHKDGGGLGTAVSSAAADGAYTPRSEGSGRSRVLEWNLTPPKSPPTLPSPLLPPPSPLLPPHRLFPRPRRHHPPRPRLSHLHLPTVRASLRSAMDRALSVARCSAGPQAAVRAPRATIARAHPHCLGAWRDIECSLSEESRREDGFIVGSIQQSKACATSMWGSARDSAATLHARRSRGGGGSRSRSVVSRCSARDGTVQIGPPPRVALSLIRPFSFFLIALAYLVMWSEEGASGFLTLSVQKIRL